MKNLFGRFTQFYQDLKLQTKFSIALILAVTVPVLMFGFFFYSRLYDMVVSYTIQQEQDASAKTSPIIEDTVQTVVDTSDRLTELPFFDTLFHMPVDAPFSSLAGSKQAEEFQKEVNALADGELITSIRIYLGEENDTAPLFFRPLYQRYICSYEPGKGNLLARHLPGRQRDYPALLSFFLSWTKGTGKLWRYGVHPRSIPLL